MNYENILFMCQKCNNYKTKSIDDIKHHINNCDTTIEIELESVKLQLEYEKLVNKIYKNIINTHTTLNLSEDVDNVISVAKEKSIDKYFEDIIIEESFRREAS